MKHIDKTDWRCKLGIHDWKKIDTTKNPVVEDDCVHLCIRCGRLHPEHLVGKESLHGTPEF